MSKTPSIDVRFRANKYELDIYAILESIPADIKNEFLKECIVEHTKAVVKGEKKSRILSRQVLCNELTDKQAELSFYVPSRDMILNEMERDYLSPKAPAKEFVYIQQEQETTTKTTNNNSTEDTTDTDANTNTDTDTDVNTNTDTDTDTNTDALDESIAVTRDDDCDNNNDDDNNDDDNNDDDNNDNNDDDYDMSNYSTFGMQGTNIFQ